MSRLAVKILIGLALLAGSFGAGYFTRQPGVQTKVETKVDTVTVDRVITKVVTVKETTPGKAVKETTTSETITDKTVKQVEKVKDKQAVRTATVKPVNNYSLGLKWQPDWKDRTWVPTGAEVGYRALGDVWVTAGYDWKNRGATVGVRYEF